MSLETPTRLYYGRTEDSFVCSCACSLFAVNLRYRVARRLERVERAQRTDTMHLLDGYRITHSKERELPRLEMLIVMSCSVVSGLTPVQGVVQHVSREP